MTLHELTFARIVRLADDIAEVIVNDGVEIDLHAVNEYHSFLLRHFPPPFSLLVNKVNSYTYTDEARRHIATLPQIHAMAVVTYDSISRHATEKLADYPRMFDWNLKIFPSRAAGLAWLTTEQLKVRNKL